MKRLAVAALLLALALVAPAGATIVIGKGIDGVTLGMTQTQVRATAGAPKHVIHGKNDFGAYTEFRYKGFQVDFQGNATATAVSTTVAREKTPGGVGVGSTRAQVQAKVPGVHCEGPAASGHCYVGRLVPGARVTDFFFRAGRVTTVVIAFVID